MKKLLFALAITVLLSSSSAYAYDRYLDGNPNWRIIYGHMDYASYMDMSSATYKYIENKGLIIVVNIIGGVNKNRSDRQSHYTRWIYIPMNPKATGYSSANFNGQELTIPPYISKNVAYIGGKTLDEWRPIRLDDNHGYNMSAKRTIELAFKAATEKEKRICQ